MNDDEVSQKFCHFTKATFPFEDKIKEVWANKKIFYSERMDWLKNLSLITSKGYYIKVTDIIPSLFKVKTEGKNDNFDIYLDGTLKAAYSFAYAGKIEETLNFILNILQQGIIQIFKHNNEDGTIKYKFLFVHLGYSYIPSPSKHYFDICKPNKIDKFSK